MSVQFQLGNQALLLRNRQKHLALLGMGGTLGTGTFKTARRKVEARIRCLLDQSHDQRVQMVRQLYSVQLGQRDV